MNIMICFCFRSERVTAAASLGWDPVVSQFAQLLAKGGSLSKEEARWVKRMRGKGRSLTPSPSLDGREILE